MPHLRRAVRVFDTAAMPYLVDVGRRSPKRIASHPGVVATGIAMGGRLIGGGLAQPASKALALSSFSATPDTRRRSASLSNQASRCAA